MGIQLSKKDAWLILDIENMQIDYVYNKAGNTKSPYF